MLNNVILMGRMVREAEYRTTPTGKTVARFTVAVERYNSGTETITDFIPCTAWNKTADFICKYFHKGNMIAVKGSLHSDSVEKDGKKQVFYSVSVDGVSFTGEQRKTAETSENAAGNEDFENIVTGDDDLPF